MDKSRKKSRPTKPKVPRGTKLPQPNGSFLVAGAGKGPAKGAANAGRPPDEWRERLRAMASRDEVLEHVATVLLAGPDHPYFDRALQYATDHGYGRAKQELEHTGKVTLETILTASHQP